MLFANFKFIADNVKEVIVDDTHCIINLKTGERFTTYSVPKTIQEFIKYVPNESYTDENGENHYIAK